MAKRLESHGANVILTRNGDYNFAIAGLHGHSAKRYDLNQRIKIIESHKTNILIAIHVNSVRKYSYEGAEVFYHPKSLEGKILASAIQQELRSIPGMKKRMTKISNCYMLRNTKMPTVLVEVGFISNPHERKLLQNPQYWDTLAGKITDGIVKYYNAPDDVMNQKSWQETTSSAYYMIRVLERSFNFGECII